MTSKQAWRRNSGILSAAQQSMALAYKRRKRHNRHQRNISINQSARSEGVVAGHQSAIINKRRKQRRREKKISGIGGEENINRRRRQKK